MPAENWSFLRYFRHSECVLGWNESEKYELLADAHLTMRGGGGSSANLILFWDVAVRVGIVKSLGQKYL